MQGHEGLGRGGGGSLDFIFHVMQSCCRVRPGDWWDELTGALRDQTAGGAASAGECGDFPVVQWLRLCALSAEGPGSAKSLSKARTNVNLVELLSTHFVPGSLTTALLSQLPHVISIHRSHLTDEETKHRGVK